MGSLDAVTYSGVSLLTALVVLLAVFSLGYARAVWVRARSDYKKTKAALPDMRKAMWSAIWTCMKIGTGVLLIYIVLTAWAVRDIRDGDKDTPLLPARSTPSATRSK